MSDTIDDTKMTGESSTTDAVPCDVCADPVPYDGGVQADVSICKSCIREKMPLHLENLPTEA